MGMDGTCAKCVQQRCDLYPLDASATETTYLSSAAPHRQDAPTQTHNGQTLSTRDLDASGRKGRPNKGMRDRYQKKLEEFKMEIERNIDFDVEHLVLPKFLLNDSYRQQKLKCELRRYQKQQKQLRREREHQY